MKTKFTSLFLAFSLLLLWNTSKAQLNYLPGGFTTSAGTYTDLGSTGTVISVSNTDDAFSTPLPIGFTFNFNGAPYDSFIFSTNGFIKLGKDTPSRHFLFTGHVQPPPNGPFTSTTSPTPASKDTSMLFAFGQDLFAGTLASEFRYATTGSPGTQVTTIQWKNVKDKTQASVGGLWDTINFQIKLYESTNVIEYRYGKWTSTVSLSAARFSAVGIVGNSMVLANQNMHLVKGSTVVWSGAVANTGFYLNNAVNYRNPTSSPAGPAPDNGRTYTFTPLTLNDASVRAVYAQGRVAMPFNMPDSIRANISNTGLNTLYSVVATLTVSGTNSYTTTTTIPVLAPNANVNVGFAPFYPTNLGSNLITVSVPNDDNNANNAKSYGLALSNTRYAYTDTLIPSSGGNGTTIAQFWGAKYFVAGSGMVTQVRSPLASNSDAVGDTVCGMVLDSTGKILARSANYIVQTADLGTTLVFNMTMPAVVTNQSIITGIAGGQTVSGLNYFLGTSQTEVPIRPNTCFYFMSQTLPGGVTMANVGSVYAAPVAWGTTRLMMECTVEPLPPVDVGVFASGPNASVKVPVGLSIPLRAVVKNFGTQTRPSGIQVRYRVNGGTIIGPVSTSVSMVPGDTTSVVFSGASAITFPSAGTYTVTMYTNLSGDGLIGNDTLNAVFTAVANNTLPYRIANGILSSWTTAGNNPVIWKEKAAPQSNGISNSNVLWADNIVVNQKEANVISPPLNFSGTTNPILHFNVAHAPNTFTGTDDTLQVLISTNGGYTYTPLYTRSSQLSSPTLGTDTPTSSSYTPTYASDWRHESVDLSAYAGNPYVTLAFRDRSASGNSVFIGNISVTNAAAISVQNVYSASSYYSGNFSILFSSIGNTNGEITFAKYTNTPYSSASPVFATNTTANTNNSSVFTPSNTSQNLWYAVTYSGIGTGNYSSSIQYSLNLDLTGVSGIFSKDSLYLLKRSDYNGSWVPVTTFVSGNNLYTGLLSGFSDFTIGSVSSVNPLPVTWQSFNAKNIDANQNILNWVTASELNTKEFIVERSTDKEIFEPIGTVKAAGTSNQKQSYSFKDVWAEPITQTIHYRLKQIDLDGNYSYSSIATVFAQNDLNTTHVTVSNPFTSSPIVWVDKPLGSGQITLNISDINGKQILTKTVVLDAPQSSFKLSELDTYNQGVYFLEVWEAGQKTSVHKILKLN
ncbi:MAG: hypothetical protein CFE21_04185 [Bacteroidetes bacterium B1(2017)]|nr:MAG: hypothetical protein CFE21_04185 [Bacteroidetes bacterium B1(2017)]